MEDEVFRKAADLLSKADYAIAFTGAGISAESGIPTFRGSGGLWSRYKPEELATPTAFARNPKLVWEWYRWRMEIIYNSSPNIAHKILSILERINIIKVVITQNVDGLHHKAGSRNVIELHGNIWRVKCIQCGFKTVLEKPPRRDELPLRCPRCGGLLRPDVVWFGEQLPPDVLTRAWEEASKADLVLVVGTTGIVEPAGSIPLFVIERGGYMINVNPEPNRYTGLASIEVRTTAVKFFREIARVLELLNQERDNIS
ncbi:MAG: NAD-dependent deacylase [Desulfurococcales archaeon]|nr:NAD-dependent deacylase [Desulfurococcales archaeon]